MIIKKIKSLLHNNKPKNCFDKKISVIENSVMMWYATCMATIDKDLLRELRPYLGSLFYFLGSIDSMCQSANINNRDFVVLAIDLLNKLGFGGKLLVPSVRSFCNEPSANKFALDANIAGGKDISQFFANRNPPVSFHIKELLEEWNKNPSLTEEEINLFFLK
jgi:hypothetical protein